LLHQVSKRLSKSEQDRKDLIRVVKRQQSAILNLKNKAGKSEATQLELIKRQSQIEQIQTDQAEKLSKASALADRLEETISQQNRIFRRIEKLSNDRARIARKLDRIEGAVTETNETVGSTPFSALLNNEKKEKKPARKLRKEKTLPSINIKEASNENSTLWSSPQRLQATIVGVLVLLILFAGLGVGHIDALVNPGPVEITSTLSPYTDTDSNTGKPEDKSLEATTSGTGTPQKAEDLLMHAEQSISTDISPFSETLPIAPFDAEEKEDDTLNNITRNDEVLLAQLKEDPQELAKQLNAIKPTAAPMPANVIDKASTSTSLPTKKDVAYNTNKDSNGAIFVEQIEAFIAATNATSQPLKKRPESRGKIIKTDRASTYSVKGLIKPDPDLPEMIKEIERRAFEGNAEAQHDIAAIYTAGHGGVKVDFKKAAIWFEAAAHQGIANARYNLGVLYHQGLGVGQDTNKAIAWYKSASDIGHPEAQYNLGIAHIEGIGTDYSPALAANFFEKAALSGIMEAAYNLGLIYENGLTGETKPKEALSWYKQAAEQGSPEAKAALEQLAKTIGVSPDSVKSPLERSKKINTYATISKSSETINASGLSLSDMEEPDITKANNAGRLQSNDTAIIAQIQEQLMRLNLYPGPADGINGPLTQDSIRSYQKSYSLATTGVPSEELLMHMLSHEVERSASPSVNRESDIVPTGTF
jgi:TPR repeat protein